MSSGARERELPARDFHHGAFDTSLLENPAGPFLAHTPEKYTTLNHLQPHQLSSCSLDQQRNLAETTRLAPVSIFNGCQSGDRLIPSRFNQNLEITRFNLMSDVKSQDLKLEPYLSVLSQITMLNRAWKSRLMIQALDKMDIAKGITNNRVLNFSSKPIFSLRKTNGPDIVDDTWKVRPRKKPLMNHWIKLVDIGDQPRPKKGMLDWSSTNLIAAVIDRDLEIYTYAQLGGVPLAKLSICNSISPPSIKISCVKWNHAGDRIAVSTKPHALFCWDPQFSKPLWIKSCFCSMTCSIRCIEWSSTDIEIVTGCTRGHVCVFRDFKRTAGSRVKSYIQLHQDTILNLVISPDDHFIATTGLDRCVRITLFPDMIPYLEIGYYDAAESLAWHPWQKGMLCIGGGIGDGSISLWDVPKQESLGFRRVDFVSHVKRVAWNELSGELVVVWYYWQDNVRYFTIPVLASWDRIVDAVPLDNSHPIERRIGNVLWNPDHTIISIQISNYIYFWNFFGHNASNWKNREANSKKNSSINQKSVFNLLCIR